MAFVVVVVAEVAWTVRGPLLPPISAGPRRRSSSSRRTEGSLSFGDDVVAVEEAGVESDEDDDCDGDVLEEPVVARSIVEGACGELLPLEALRRSWTAEENSSCCRFLLLR